MDASVSSSAMIWSDQSFTQRSGLMVDSIDFYFNAVDSEEVSNGFLIQKKAL